MKISRLKRASNYEVEDWLIKALELSPYQKEKLRDRELVRFSKFSYYKQTQEIKSSVLWRLTIIAWIPYWAILILGLPFGFLLTGRWGYTEGLLDKFHRPWAAKIGL